MEEQEKHALNFEAFNEQKKRFLNEAKKHGVNYIKNMLQMIDDGLLKNKALTTEELSRACSDAIGTFDLKNAEKSAKLNRMLGKR